MSEGNQERNIMILFLSNLHGQWKNPSRKTILEWNTKENGYTICVPEKPLCKETNEAPLADAMAFLGKPLDAIFYFSTKQVGMYPLPEGATSEKRITILFPPDFKAHEEYDSEAHFFWTECAPKVLGENFTEKTKLFPVPFDESAPDPVQSTILSVKAMEDAIRDYLRAEGVLEQGEKPLAHCHLYVDVTGGIRTANMAMSAVMQLLVYQDAKLERVMYSDFQELKVSNVQPIHDLYKLVAGVYAFTQYGRSEALKEYFGDEPYTPLKALRKAMDDFSEAVQLCQEGLFEKALESLMRELDNFSSKANAASNPSAKVQLFMNMVPNLRAVYDKLAKVHEGRYATNRLAIIRWCVDNRLLQQAVTFCTEWLPEYLINHGVVYVEDAGIQEALKKHATKKDPVGKEYFLRQFLNDEGAKIDQLHSKSHTNVISRLLADRNTMEYDDDPALQGFVRAFKEFLGSIRKDLPAIKEGKPTKNMRLKAVFDDLVQPADGKPGMHEKNVKESNVLHKLVVWVKDLDKWYRGDLFGLPQDVYDKKKEHFIKDDQSGNAARRAQAMLDVGFLKTSLTERDEKDAVYYIKEYTYIRTKLRNKICHADDTVSSPSAPDGVKMEVKSIAVYLNGYLDKLDALKDKPKPHFKGLWDENETWKKEAKK